LGGAFFRPALFCGRNFKMFVHKMVLLFSVLFLFPLFPELSCVSAYVNAQETETSNDESKNNTVPVEVTVQADFPEDFEMPDYGHYFRGLIFLLSFIVGVLLFHVFINSLERGRI
jgi:hypothetical protein